MTKLLGHVLRIVGLLLEMLGVWGVYTGATGGKMTRVEMPGGESVPVAWLAVGLGFVLWLAGMLMISLSRRPRWRREPDLRELDL